MSAGKHYEIERKYLIAMPDTAFLAAQPGCEVWEIEQVYLTAQPGETRRVRRVTENGAVRCYKTFKVRLNALTAQEDEGLISPEEYAMFLEEAAPGLKTVLKTRYRVPHAGQVLEFDVYPFWKDRAVMEIELGSEKQETVIPGWVKVFREVTEDFRYKNVSLAREIPMDALE